MPKKDDTNVACVKYKDENWEEIEDCDDEPFKFSDLWIKKTFSDGSKIKTVKIWDEIEYKITFGNKGDAKATITSIKDFLPKNVEYISSEIYVVVWNNSYLLSWSEVIDTNTKVDGVYVDIYWWITLAPKSEWYILLKWKVLWDFLDNRINYACIYLNDEKIDCDNVIHNITTKLMCTKPEIKTKSFTTAWWSTEVVCKTSSTWEKADSIELNCGDWAVISWTTVSILTWSNIVSLTGTCVYPSNTTSSSKSYTVQCKVNEETTDECKDTVSVAGTNPPSTCFVAWTKVTMADGTQKNIEDVKIWEKILGEWWINTVLWYDRPVLWERHLWSINGWEYFVSDEHPFKTTQWWKSFNPEMTKLEIDLNTTELKVWDILVTAQWQEEINSVDYIDADYDTPLYNLLLDGDHTYYANGYLVHNKWWWGWPSCKSITTDPDVTTSLSSWKDIKVTCTATSDSYILIDCNYKEWNKYDESNKNFYVSSGRVTTFTWTCKNYTQNSKIQCLIKEYETSSWQSPTSACWKNVTIWWGGSSCFVAWTKVTMADWTKKNIEDVEIWDKVLWQDWEINTVLWYDRPSLWSRHLWSINGWEYFVSDEHPFMTTQWWKSFNPEMTKLEIDLNTTELKLWDTLVTEKWLERIKTVDYIDADDSTQLYNFVLDGNHTYYANNYLVHNKGWGSCFIAWTKVVMADWSEKNIEDVKIWEKIMWENWVNTVLWYDRPILRSRHLWSINGWEYFVSDEHPFKTTQWWKSFNPEMTKLEIDLNTTELKLWDILITKNGLEMVKSIDYIDADYNTQLYNFVLDGDHTYYANNYLVHNKWWWGGWWGTPTPVIWNSAACFNVNTNQVSIEQWEIFPFFWNVSNMDNIKDIATELPWGYGVDASAVKNIITSHNNEKCSSDKNGYIALNSMLCSFEIKNLDNDKVVYKGDFPCLRDTWWKWINYVSDKGLLNAWMTYWKDKYRWDGTYKFFWSFKNEDNNLTLRSNLNYIENFWANVSTFWEYQIILTDIRYLQCRDESWTDVPVKLTEPCANNFTLTSPFTVQKTPSGNLTASTDALKYYKYCIEYSKDGKCIKDSKASLLLNNIATADYKANDAVRSAMKKFINKYSKLAVNAGNWLKKVPGKNIYFIESNICLWSECNSTIKLDKPTTLVQTKWSTEIKWDVDTDNLMLLTYWKIKFTDSNSCNHRQVVKWIFYAESWIERTPVQKNTNINNAKRCTQWWLTIKWVLIWEWLNSMMKNSRSNLNGWFDSKTQQTVMNWASVLIEYSPSVFTKGSMPPGAEDFTTALSIYKN